MSKPNWLLQMQALEAAATKGSWYAHYDGVEVRYTRSSFDCLADCTLELETEQGKKNAAFIAASRSFVPKALECIRDLSDGLRDFIDPDLSYVGRELLKKWGLE